MERARVRDAASYAPFAFDRPEEVPAFAVLGGEVKVTASGSAHDKQGRLRKNSPEVIEVLLHLQRKIDAHTQEMALVRPDLESSASCLLISYGVTARASRQAVRMLRSRGFAISFLQVQTLFPVPRQALDRALAGVETVFVAEENLTGQYRAALSSCLDGKRVYGINKVGSLISPREIIGAVEGVMS
jgi:2-oxoglutarate ferredoxin oxidoreductase subunit alpha